MTPARPFRMRSVTKNSLERSQKRSPSKSKPNQQYSIPSFLLLIISIPTWQKWDICFYLVFTPQPATFVAPVFAPSDVEYLGELFTRCKKLIIKASFNGSGGFLLRGEHPGSPNLLGTFFSSKLGWVDMFFKPPMVSGRKYIESAPNFGGFF